MDLHRSPGGDEIDYLYLAHSLCNRHEFAYEGIPTAVRTPGYPLILSILDCFKLSRPEYARLLSLIISSIHIYFLYSLIHILTNNTFISFIFSVGGFLFGYGMQLSTSILAEPLAALLITIIMYLLIKKYPLIKVQDAILLGAISGYAVLVRGYLVFIPFFIALWMWLTWRNSLSMYYIVAFLFLISVWIVRNGVVMGSYTLSTQGAREILSGNHPLARGSWLPPEKYLPSVEALYPEIKTADEVQASKIYAKSAIYFIKSDIGHFLWLIPRKLAIYFWPKSEYMGWNWAYFLSLGFAVLLLITSFISHKLIHVLGRREKAVILLILFIQIAAILPIVLTFGDPRFRYPIESAIYLVTSILLNSYLRVRWIGAS